MSRHGLVSAHTSNVCITRNALDSSIHCMCQTICDVTSSNFLGRLVQCEQDRGRWVGIYTQRVKTTWLCVGLAEKNPSAGSLYKWSWKTVISPHRASMHAALPKQLDH